MKYLTRRHCLEKIKHILNSLVTFISYMHNCHIFSLPSNRQILNVL